MIRILLGLLLLFSFPLMANQNTLPMPQLIFQALKDCYDKEHKRFIALGKCIVIKMQSYPNPDGYKVEIQEDISKRFTMVIYNKYGHILHCNGTALDTIYIENCKLTQSDSVAPTQKFSIQPPSQ